MEDFWGIEELWEEENTEANVADPQGSDLRNVGVSTGDFDPDFDTSDDLEAGQEAEDAGAEGLDVAGPVADAGSAAGAAGAPPPAPGA